MNEVVSRQRIMNLEQAIYSLPRVEMPVTHHFSSGVYMRELFIPAGTVLTGKIHLTEHFSILLEGEISVMTEQGMQTVKAPHISKSLPGMKRAGFAHTDTRWLTIHPTSDTDPDVIEQKITTNDYEDPRLEQK